MGDIYSEQVVASRTESVHTFRRFMAGTALMVGSLGASLAINEGRVSADHPCLPGESDPTYDAGYEENGVYYPKPMCADGDPAPANPPVDQTPPPVDQSPPPVGQSPPSNNDPTPNNPGNSGGTSNEGNNGNGNGNGNIPEAPPQVSEYQHLRNELGCAEGAGLAALQGSTELAYLQQLVNDQNALIAAANSIGLESSPRTVEVLEDCPAPNGGWLPAENTPGWFDVATQGRSAHFYDVLLPRQELNLTPVPSGVVDVNGDGVLDPGQFELIDAYLDAASQRTNS